MKKLAISKTQFLLGFSDSGFPTEELRAGRSRRRRPHSTLNGAMSGREGVPPSAGVRVDMVQVEPLDEAAARSCKAAAGGGHLERLKYLHENGYPWDKWTCRAAAEGDHLECMKYLHENGCPWNEGTCRTAARGGHLECLKYLHENGCPWDKRAC